MSCVFFSVVVLGLSAHCSSTAQANVRVFQGALRITGVIPPGGFPRCSPVPFFVVILREDRRQRALNRSDRVASGKHAEDVSEAIKMRRRNTIQRDAMHASIKDEHIEHHVHA